MSEIVLLDTGSDFNNIKCISMTFDEDIPQYYAISYRWGRHPVWKAQTPNYMAYITSVSQDNLIRLCEILRSQIRYVWIDVVCINQADIFHRKMAIKNMDKIYRRAERIIAVPDLCYCDGYPRMQNVTKEDIDLAVKKISQYEAHCSKSSDFQERRRIWPSKGVIFVREVIQEWACRCWVISERVIGLKDNKLDIIIVRAGGTKISYEEWRSYLFVDWNINFDQATLVNTIINSKSTKYIDRLFAILPHTKYQNAVRKLVDEGRSVANMVDLKMTLLDILDIEGKIVLLRHSVSEQGDFRRVLPLFTKRKKYRLPAASLSDQNHYCNVEPALQDGKPAIKVSGYYNIKPTPAACRKLSNLFGLKAKSVLDIVLVKEHRGYYTNPWQRCLRCIKTNGIWIVDSIRNEQVPQNECYKRGEFVVF